MKRKDTFFIIITLLLLAFTSGINAQSSLLWEISGNGLKSPSYIYGTIHIIPGVRFFLPDTLGKIIAVTDKVVLELDMDDPSLLAETQKDMMMDNTVIDSLVSKPDLDYLTKFFNDTIGIPYSLVNRIKPMLLESFIAMKMAGDKPQSYENNFLTMANTHNKEIIGLETVKEQMAVFDQVSITDQVKYLMDNVKRYSSLKTEFNQLIDAYTSQNLDEIYRLMMETDTTDARFDSIIVNKRNKNWIPRIEKLVQNQPCFIAVGSGHLAGNEGVLALLRKEGYTVKPVRMML